MNESLLGFKDMEGIRRKLFIRPEKEASESLIAIEPGLVEPITNHNNSHNNASSHNTTSSTLNTNDLFPFLTAEELKIFDSRIYE